MFAAHDQENLTHAHQAAAAAKPLNRGLGAKTPGKLAPKTPFKIPLNDENGQRGGKSAFKPNGKGNENLLQLGKKGGDVDKSAFVTPAGPRTRAPLGMKTTNAKTKAFQTPAPASIDNNVEKTQQKTQSPRMRRAKVKIHLGDATPTTADTEEREIEYMPPRGEPLPDHDETLEMIDSFPMFENGNLTRGIYETYWDPVDDGGIPLSLRIAAEKSAKFEKEMEDKYLDQIEEDHIATLESLGFTEVAEKERVKRAAIARAVPLSKPTGRPVKVAVKSAKPVEAVKPKPQRLPGTIAARSAATALSRPPLMSTAAAGSTASMRARAPIAKPMAVPKKVHSTATVKQPSSAMRATAAAVVSKNTIGYGRGRATSGALRKHPMTLQELSGTKLPQNGRVTSLGDKDAELERRMMFGGLELDDGLDDDLFGAPSRSLTFGDDSDEEFQLQIPADF